MRSFALATAVTALALAALTACGGADSEPTTGAGGSGGEAGHGGGGDAGGHGGGHPSSSVSGSASGGATLTCDSYCDQIQANCAGATAQYPSREACMATCATFAPGELGDMNGNTLACRIYHSGTPARNDPATHCAHGGPEGADATHCGPPCASFCNLVMAVCPQTGGGEPSTGYADKADCMSQCAGYGTTTYSANVKSGNSVECRIYYATLASTDPSQCVNTAATSSLCK